MNFRTGNLLRFADYLARECPDRDRPRHWPGAEIRCRLATVEHLERGALALVSGEHGPGAEIAPGISMTVQVVAPGEVSSSHAHSFWHVYVVLSGQGSAHIGAQSDELDLRERDVLYIPPWGEHAFRCTGAEPLVLYALQNLPQLARLGALARRERGEEVQLVFRASGD